MLCCFIKEVIEEKCTAEDDLAQEMAKTSHEEETLAGFDLEETTYGE